MTAEDTVGALLAALEGLEDGWTTRNAASYGGTHWTYCTICDLTSDERGRIEHAPGCAVSAAREAMVAARAYLEPEPTTRQLEALNNADSWTSDYVYRAAMKDAGRGRMLS